MYDLLVSVLGLVAGLCEDWDECGVVRCGVWTLCEDPARFNDVGAGELALELGLESADGWKNKRGIIDMNFTRVAERPFVRLLQHLTPLHISLCVLVFH